MTHSEKSALRSNNTDYKKTLKVLSIHWGFSLGGVGKYALLINNVNHYAPVKIYNLAILAKNWWYDEHALNVIKSKKIFIKSRKDISWMKEVTRYINHLKPDLIMTHGFNGHFVALTTRVLSKKNIPFICSYHGSYHAMTSGRKLVEGIFNFIAERFIRHFAISCVVVAAYTKKCLVERGIADEKITVIHNGIDGHKLPPNAREKLRDEWGIEKHEIVIGVASRLDPIKGVHFLVEAFEKLTKRYDNIRLIVVGSGTCEEELKSRTKNYRIDNKVIFTGFRSDIPACLEAIDIFVLPSLSENHSIGLLEAMRAGKAIVATDVGGNTESVRHMKEGIIVPPKNVDSLVGAITEIVENASFSNAFGMAARSRFCEDFSVEKMVRLTAKWLLKCGEMRKGASQYNWSKTLN